MKDLPKDFYPTQKILQTIEYDSNFFAEKPRSFRTTIFDKGGSQRFENLPPKFNESRGCYTLNFFGRVGKPSARNFQLIAPNNQESQDDEFYLSHGK